MENDWTTTHDAMVANIAEKDQLINELIEEKVMLVNACRMAYRVLLQINDHEDYTIRTINDLRAALERAERGKS